MEYTVNRVKLGYETQVERNWGPDIVLLDHATDITEPNDWNQTGFTIQELFDANTNALFHKVTRELLIQCWEEAGLSVELGFKLDQYHTLVEDLPTHLAAVDKTKLLHVDRFPISVGLMENRVSEICSVGLKAKNPFDGQSVFHFRVIRPQQKDHNPLHRDIWLEDYDDCINIYIPVAGSNEHSSLILIPGSHRWPESRIEKTQGGAVIGGVKFNVPAVTSIKGSYDVVRPNPSENQLMVFSPYLIHGGAANMCESTTRISIEMRFWKK